MEGDSRASYVALLHVARLVDESLWAWKDDDSNLKSEDSNSTSGADTLDVSALMQAIRSKDQRILAALYASPWLRALCVPQCFSDAFTMALV